VSATTRRIVTGHLADGRSVVLSDGQVSHTRSLPGARFDEVWSVESAPAALGPAPTAEPTSASPRIALGSGEGHLIRVIEFAPANAGGVRSPMHRTRTIDYGIVLEGEVVLITETGETTCRAGDLVIDRGIVHGWRVDTPEPCVVALVMIDALPVGAGKNVG